ncbi:choline dehydrogenase-like flavoprotein [Rhodobacter sp. JA431]|uniref:GMC oxidoreductase n=1 Tax=Rhodobacter sp. JA431 TaxID=570013 RepID=UPI000BC77556|nr:GMC family oxidoreductase [Rhodobacter sp. JA431]SOC00286.1 choline dehydrogenase-like flavoprotein [Rhodobacter sp. JA431]
MELNGLHDAVVIGSGAGGAAAAWQLCDLGLRVLLLEAGPAFDPVVDYPLDTPGWERRPFPVKSGSRAQVSWGDLGTLAPEDEDLADWSQAGFPWRLPTGSARPPLNEGYFHVMGVGGSTLHFVGEAHRFHPDAFRAGSLTGDGADWPIAYADLEPYYTRVEQMIGVAGTPEDNGRWRSQPYPLPAHPLSPGAQVLLEAGKKIGQGWQVNPHFTLSEPYDDRPPCNYCGQCARGCPLGDKGSTDVSLLRRAHATGRLTLIPYATVTQLHPGPGGRIERATVIVGDVAQDVETPMVFLAAGAVQTPRLLLASANRDHAEGLANGSGQLGRNFMETLSLRSVGLAKAPIRSQFGLPADAIWWGPGAQGGFRLNHTTSETGLNGPIAYANRLLPGFGNDLKAAMRQNFGAAIAVGAIGQVVPDARSHIRLDPQLRDAFGQPIARISSVLTPQSIARLRAMRTAARAVLAAADTTLVEEASSRDTFSATHVFGTARMGRAAETSVVTPLCRAHDHENLWITDASVFPSSGFGESPSLTIMALALRAAEAAVT